jgi:hypothetical protein
MIPYRLVNFRTYPHTAPIKDARRATIVITPNGIEDPNYDIVMVPPTTAIKLYDDELRVGHLLVWDGWDWMIDDNEAWYDDWWEVLYEVCDEWVGMHILRVSRQCRTLL